MQRLASPRPPAAHAVQWKLSRGLGIANLVVIHRLSDLLTAGDAGSRGRALAEGLLADCSTCIITGRRATNSRPQQLCWA